MDDRPFWLCKDEHCDDYITYRQDPYCLYGNEKYKNAFQVIPTVRPDNLDADGKIRPGSTGTNLMSADEAKQMFDYLFKRFRG